MIFLTIILIIIVILSLFTVTIKARVMGFVNLIDELRGLFSVRIGRFSVYSGTIELHGNKITITDKKSRATQIQLSADRSDKDSLINYLDNAFIKIIQIYDFDIYFSGGVSSNAMAGALITAGARAAMIAVGSYLKNIFPALTITQDATSDFERDELQLSFNCIIGLSIADIIYGLISAQIIKIKLNKLRQNK